MGVGAPRETVQRDAEGTLAAVRMMELTVTADHRVLDGAEVARFLQTLRDSVKVIIEMEAWKPPGLDSWRNKRKQQSIFRPSR